MHVNTTHNPDTPTNTITTTSDNRSEDLDYICPHCDRTFTSHIGLVGHLRIHRTENGEPVPGAPTFTRRTRLYCPHCPRTFMHCVRLFGHMRIHGSGTDRSPNTPSTPTVPSLSHTPSPCAPTTTTTTISVTDTDATDFSCPYCPRTFTSRIGLSIALNAAVDSALNEDGRVDVIYTDFKKAFDSVPHKRLIYKLSEIGIRGRLLTWITDSLTGRSQTVCVEASTSTPTPVLGGVLQGSVLGPLLFLVYINDCVDDLGCSAIMFADDVGLWRAIRYDADTYALQDSLNRLNSWSARWLLNLNVDKCVVLRLRTKKTSKEDDSFQYVLGGQPLANVVEQKDLGVLMISSLKPSSQC
ncbi:hypothetical protein SprV_0100409600 [Sparganum proliferum]